MTSCNISRSSVRSARIVFKRLFTSSVAFSRRISSGIRPDVGVAAGREITALPAVIFLRPTCREPRNHARRQVGRVCPKDRRQRLLKIAGGDGAQVKHRQQSIETFGPTAHFGRMLEVKRIFASTRRSVARSRTF